MKFRQIWFLFILMAGLGGCSPAVETVKTVWGNSTRALEDARVDAIARKYHCNYDACFDTILALGRNELLLVPKNQKFFDVFIKDRIKSVVVVMGIKGNVDTTEVGIFLTEEKQDIIRLEVTSLSTSAKEKVAKAIFDELTLHFSEAE